MPEILLSVYRSAGMPYRYWFLATKEHHFLRAMVSGLGIALTREPESRMGALTALTRFTVSQFHSGEKRCWCGFLTGISMNPFRLTPFWMRKNKKFCLFFDFKRAFLGDGG